MKDRERKRKEGMCKRQK